MSGTNPVMEQRRNDLAVCARCRAPLSRHVSKWLFCPDLHPPFDYQFVVEQYTGSFRVGVLE